MSELFYVFGIGLTLLAIALAFFGLRSESFPNSRGIYAGVLGVMGALVVASCAFAVVLSREEQEHRREEVAEFRAEEEALAAEEAEGGGEEAEEPEDAAEPEAGDPIALTSPEDGSLVFDPTELVAPVGEVTIAYTNPSEVPHNVAIEAEGETLAQGATVTGGEAGDATADLEAGDYVYYCSIPGHRESGMEGALAVE